jgi:succinoglycan biosynthesis protein ExoA
MTTNRQPFVSVVLPIRNEAAFIERTLEAVFSQTYPADRFEVLIADGMSTDDTRAIVTTVAARHPQVRSRIIDNPRGIVPTGLNLAITAAAGDVIVRVDGHTIVAPDYIAECVRVLRESHADNAGGRMDAVSDTAFGRAVALATSSPFGVGGSRFHYSTTEEWVDTVYMGAWPRSVFGWNGLFDEELVRNQDDEFNYRLVARGGRIRLSPSIKSCYYARSTPGGVCRQYGQYGFWKVRVMQKHLQQMSPRHFVPALFVTALVGLAALAPMLPVSRWLLAAVVGTYAAGAAAATLLVVARGTFGSHVLLVPVTFAMLHVSYGSGFLAGLCAFYRRRRSETPSPQLTLAARQ